MVRKAALKAVMIRNVPLSGEYMIMWMTQNARLYLRVGNRRAHWRLVRVERATLDQKIGVIIAVVVAT